MKLFSVQMALFTKEEIKKPNLIYDTVNEKTGNIFTDMPIMMKLPSDVPSEIPRVQAKSEDSVYSLNVSLSRVDFFINPSIEAEVEPEDMFKNYKGRLEKYYKAVTSAIDITRVGVVLSLYEEEEDNVKRIFDKYSPEKYVSAYSEITYRTNLQSMSNNMIINNIKQIESGEMHNQRLNIYRKGIMIELDTNNIEVEGKVLTNEEVSKILTLAADKIKNKAVKELI